MQQRMKRFSGILLSLALILGLMPGMSLTAYADDDPPYAQYKNTTTVIKFAEKDWYLINYDTSTVTLLAKECVASSMYNESVSFVEYSNNTTVKTVVDNYYNNSISADAQTAVSGNAMFLLTTAQAMDIKNADVRKCSRASGADMNGWWLCSQGNDGQFAAFVDGGFGDVMYGTYVTYTLGVRPALKLNLASVIFSSESKTFALKQTIDAGNVTATYGDTDKKVSASVTKPATSGGAISYTVKTGSEDFIAVDSTTGALTIKKVPSDGRAYVIVTAAESGNYGKTTKEVTVTINKANAAPATVTANNCTYDGAEKPLVTVTGTASGGTMQYALGTKDAATQPYTTSIPTATNAGTYYVWYKVVGDSNHYDCDPKCVCVTISAAGSPDNKDLGQKDPNNQDPGKKDPNNGGNNQGGGNRKDKKTEKITISKRPSSVKAKAKKNKVTVSWKKIKKNKVGKKLLKQIKSIQVQYSTDKTFKKDVKTKTVGKKKTKVTLKVQKKITYYIRVRYKGSNGFSKWSKVKKVKTK